MEKLLSNRKPPNVRLPLPVFTSEFATKTSDPVCNLPHQNDFSTWANFRTLASACAQMVTFSSRPRGQDPARNSIDNDHQPTAIGVQRWGGRRRSDRMGSKSRSGKESDLGGHAEKGSARRKSLVVKTWSWSNRSTGVESNQAGSSHKGWQPLMELQEINRNERRWILPNINPAKFLNFVRGTPVHLFSLDCITLLVKSQTSSSTPPFGKDWITQALYKSHVGVPSCRCRAATSNKNWSPLFSANQVRFRSVGTPGQTRPRPGAKVKVGNSAVIFGSCDSIRRNSCNLRQSQFTLPKVWYFTVKQFHNEPDWIFVAAPLRNLRVKVDLRECIFMFAGCES